MSINFPKLTCSNGLILCDWKCILQILFSAVPINLFLKIALIFICFIACKMIEISGHG